MKNNLVYLSFINFCLEIFFSSVLHSLPINVDAFVLCSDCRSFSQSFFSPSEENLNWCVSVMSLFFLFFQVTEKYLLLILWFNMEQKTDKKYSAVSIRHEPKRKPIPCAVCTAPAMYSYVGVIVCPSCKVFFKRNAENKTVSFIFLEKKSIFILYLLKNITQSKTKLTNNSD